MEKITFWRSIPHEILKTHQVKDSSGRWGSRRATNWLPRDDRPRSTPLEAQSRTSGLYHGGTLWLCQKNYGKWPIYSFYGWSTYERWWFSIVRRVYQRVLEFPSPIVLTMKAQDQRMQMILFPTQQTLYHVCLKIVEPFKISWLF